MAVERILAGVGFSAPAFGLADGLQNTMKRTVSRLRRRLAKDPALLTKLDTGLQAAGVAPRK